MKKFFKKLSSISQETKIGLTIAFIAVFFFGVIGISQKWWQPTQPSTSSGPKTNSSIIENSSSSSINSSKSPSSSSNVPVVSPLDEIIAFPCATNVSVVRHFFEVTDDSAKQAASVVFYEGKYVASKGVDFAKEDNSKFNVFAAASGEVISKVEDAKYGLTVTVLSANNVKFVYSSLSSTNVVQGQEIGKGVTIGQAGQAVFGSDLNKNHLHLEIFVLEEVINPEKCFSKTIGEVSL